MTKPELIASYVSGRLARRDFVRGLTALGVSATAAAAYAHTLTPAASASGGRDAAGYRVRAQDDDYGGGDFGDLEEVIQLLIRIITVLLGILGGFGAFKTTPLRLQSGDEIDVDDTDQIGVLSTQLSSHAEALTTLLRDLGGSPESITAPELSYSSVDDVLFDMQQALETQQGVFAAVIPAITSRQALSTLISIGLVQGRHTAFVNRLLGESAFPATFQQAATSEETDSLIAGL